MAILSDSFSFTGSWVSWTVPWHVPGTLKVRASGGSGGSAFTPSSEHRGGQGGAVVGLLAATLAGKKLWIAVGGNGVNAGSGSAGGWSPNSPGGDGSTGNSRGDGAGGGGATEIRRTSTSGSLLAIVGGGGTRGSGGGNGGGGFGGGRREGGGGGYGGGRREGGGGGGFG